MISSLNTQQQAAITDEAKRILVIAGAGSGKTKSLLQKIEYLVKEKGVQSDKILAITFTRNAANEMIDRLIFQNDPTGSYQHTLEAVKYTEERRREFRNSYKATIDWINNLTMTTFHGFCYQLMKGLGVKVYDNKFHLLVDEEQEKVEDGIPAKETASEVIKRVISICAAENPDFLLLLREYIINNYHKPEKNPKPSTPPIPADYYYTTLKGDRVRSKSEVYIADWLYRHEIEYQYERPVRTDSKTFYPDFYIPEAGIYLEHVSDYSQGTGKKEEALRFRGERMAKTFEVEMYDSGKMSRKLDAILRNRLDRHMAGPVLLSVKETLEPYTAALERFSREVKQTIDFIKVSGQDATVAITKGKAESYDRINQYYTLFEKIWWEYHRYCAAKSYLDFNDLISQSIKLLNEHTDIRKHLQNRFDYILVDEFQDVNVPQVNLIQALLKPQTQLFCVGDDWQSIYGFRGSQVDYTVNFNKYFPSSTQHFLNLNYRSTHSIVTAGNEVIKLNEKKIEKEVKAWNESVTDIMVYLASKRDEDDVEFVTRKVSELNSAGFDKDDILILYRRSLIRIPFFDALKTAGAQATFKTIHGAKGLEAKVVFILGLNNTPGGFPDVWLSDRIYQIIRPQDRQDLIEEERRLFYVAITRAKQHLFLISALGCESEFLTAIPKQFVKRITLQMDITSDIAKCPSCGAVSYGLNKFCGSCGVALES